MSTTQIPQGPATAAQFMPPPDVAVPLRQILLRWPGFLFDEEPHVGLDRGPSHDERSRGSGERLANRQPGVNRTNADRSPWSDLVVTRP